MKLAYKIALPENLIDTYEFLQGEFNRVLSDDVLRDAILSVDNSLQPGHYWPQLRDLIGHETQRQWAKDKRFPSPSWYFCAFAEQIRQMHKAQKEQTALYDALQEFDNQDNAAFYQYCVDNNIPFSKTKVKNLQHCKERPGLPRSATFVLDFAFINTHAARMINNNFYYSIFDENQKHMWCQLPIIIHQSSKYQPGMRISKPKFSKDKNGNYYGVIAFDFDEGVTHGENIAAIDLGKVNLYTFAYIRPDGSYSDNYYIHSKMIERLKQKLDNLYEERRILIEKNERVDTLFAKAQYIPEASLQKWMLRQGKLERLSTKITHVKNAITAEMSAEIAELCHKHNCPTLFMENLSWLESQGGKWNHSAQQDAIELSCSQRGITTYKVNAKNTSKEHPITGELGKELGRNIVWSTGDMLDRDFVSCLNQVQREGKRRVSNRRVEKKHGIRVTSLRDKHQATPKRTKRQGSRRRENLEKLEMLRNKNTSRTIQMVVVLPRTSEDCTATWSCVEKTSIQEGNNCMRRINVYKQSYMYLCN